VKRTGGKNNRKDLKKCEQISAQGEMRSAQCELPSSRRGFFNLSQFNFHGLFFSNQEKNYPHQQNQNHPKRSKKYVSKNVHKKNPGTGCKPALEV
jgi:hypothetical protein